VTQDYALVVSEPGPGADALRDCLVANSTPAEILTPAALAANPPDPDDGPAVLLLNADLPPDEVMAAARGVGGTPTVVAFAERDFDRLSRFVDLGMDYLVPPFEPALVRRRLSICMEREALSRQVRHIEDVANLVKYERELQIGQEIQRGFLPESLPKVPGWEIEARFRPAREVAGDFYDAFPLVGGRRVGFVVADVCDKGVGAALFMALIRTLLRHTACRAESLSPLGLEVEWADPVDDVEVDRGSPTAAGIGPLLTAIAGTHAYMTDHHLAQGYFATLFFGVLDPATGALLYINCGHNPPVIRRASGEQVMLEPTGPALGMLPDSQFRIGRSRLAHGDVLFIYTDGVPEAKDQDGRFFSMERTRELVADPFQNAGELLDRIDGALYAHVGTASPYDDITMMAVGRIAEP
jgi:sigma-B regulation protein RsbU (phosphoserine phosphatase)